MQTAVSASNLVKLAFEHTAFPGSGMLFEPLPSECDSSAFLLAIEPDPHWLSFLRLLENSDFEMQRVYGSCVAFMTPDGFAYYAPAMLIFAMNPDSDILAEMMMMDVTPTAATSNTAIGRAVNELTETRLLRFTTSQKQAIAAVAEFLSSQDPDDGIFTSVWGYWRYWLQEFGC